MANDEFVQDEIGAIRLNNATGVQDGVGFVSEDEQGDGAISSASSNGTFSLLQLPPEVRIGFYCCSWSYFTFFYFLFVLGS